MLSRESIDIGEWKEKLIQFDITFYSYFEDILKTLMPKEYLDNSLDFEELINTALSLEEWIKAQNKVYERFESISKTMVLIESEGDENLLLLLLIFCDDFNRYFAHIK
ncbi:hypothetical protein CW734_00925 (plasmid) [Planococcus sp. MB-3u-03]|uniref:hypothetical protein n=1 Tax=Planococcus sp. MB-3u-03 TaxID=2058136 RepID=UPI000C324DAF|nr:hypothetical protein [Planococcus sp. MB-3u-03]AUD12460.1 hypothetical protein CW734_00925 [Planococcus sp. MB-3u-03]